MRFLLALALLVAAAPAPAARLEPAEPGLGQRARLHLDAAPADSTQWPEAANAALRPTSDPRVFELVPLRVGALRVVLPATGDTLRFEVSGAIEDVASAELRPLRSVGDIGPHWGPTAALIALALVLVFAPLLWWWRRRSGRRAPRPAPPPEPAHVVALRELDRLERSGLLEAGRLEEFYVRGSHVLREYAELRFGVPVLDRTTTETVAGLREHPLAAAQLPLVEPLLGAADEVKFARHRPAVEDGSSWLARAREFVHRTTPRPAEGPTAGGPGAPGPVAEVSA